MPPEPFPRVLGDLAARKATGCLEVRAGSVTREIFLKKGNVVQARSRTMKEALGRLLLDQGWVTEAQLDEALDEAASDGRQLGDVLIAKGFLSPTEVLEALTEQVKLRVFNAFRLSEYEWRFEEGTLPKMVFQVRLPAAPLVVEGVSVAYSVDRIMDELALTEDTAVQATAGAGEAGRRLSLGPREQRLLHLVEAPITVERLIEVGEHSYLKLLRFLFALWCLRLLEVVPQPAAEAEPQAGGGAPAEEDRPEGAAQAEGTGLVEEDEAAPAREEAGEVGAPRDPATPPEAGAAHGAQAGTTAMHLEVGDLEDARRTRLRRHLLDRYRKRSRQPTPTPVPARRSGRARTGSASGKRRGSQGGAARTLEDDLMALFLRLPRLDYFALLGISVKASVSDVKIAYGGFLRKWRLEHVPDEWSDEAKRAAEALLDRATEALTVLTDTERRHRYLQQRATGGSTVYEEDRQVLLAGVALQKAGRARERGELDEAEQILRRALEKVPEEASLWLRLGIVLVDKVREGERALQEEAVQVLRKAVSLDPALDLPWVYIGRLAEVRGEVDLAAKLYRKALSVNPESELAASGLKSLERRKEGKGSLIDRLLGKKK